MRTRTIGLVSLLSMGLLLNGCGESSTSDTKELNPTDITVERGAVYAATVTDAAGSVATQKMGENVYRFSDTPKYPISVTGGWIDVDGDGKKTVNDVTLNHPMYSYSNMVTPLTSYIADSNVTLRESRLTELQNRFSIDAEELSKLPSLSTQNAMLLQNAIYSELIKNDNNSSLVTLSDVETLFTSLQTLTQQSSGSTEAELQVLIEKEVVSDLVLHNKLEYIPLEDADMSASQKDQFILSQRDFTLTTLPLFNSQHDLNLSTEYFSNEVVFSGINTPLQISLSNTGFTLVKNDSALSSSTTTVEDGDRVKVSFITSGTFSVLSSVSFAIENEFSDELSDSLTFSDAESTCRSVGLTLPNAADISQYVNDNVDKLSQVNYWVSDNYYTDIYGYVYNINTKNKSVVRRTAAYSVVCTKKYEPILYTVETMSDPNQAPIANAGQDMKVYYTDGVTLDASQSSDDVAIASYEWVENGVTLSNGVSFSKSDFTIGNHTITLNVTDDEGKTSSDTLTLTIYDTFVNILPMDEVGGSKSVSSYSNGGLATITLGEGSQLYFKISNDLARSFTVSKFSIVSTYNGSDTLRVVSTNTALLNNGKLEDGESISLGYTLTSSQTANYWNATYELTDALTGETFTNSFKWSGVVW